MFICSYLHTSHIPHTIYMAYISYITYITSHTIHTVLVHAFIHTTYRIHMHGILIIHHIHPAFRTCTYLHTTDMPGTRHACYTYLSLIPTYRDITHTMHIMHTHRYIVQVTHAYTHHILHIYTTHAPHTHHTYTLHTHYIHTTYTLHTHYIYTTYTHLMRR
ncbi:hypothetical protein D3C77_336330 [compost metagenome]